MNKFILILTAFGFFSLSCGTGKKVVTQTEFKTIAVAETPKEKIIEAIPPSPVTVEKIEEKIKEVEEEVLVPVKPVKEILIEKSTEAFNHNLWNDLLQKHVSNQGNVNYKGFKEDRTQLKAYLDELASNLPKESWTKDDKMAYWINVYNAYTVKLILDNYPTTSIKDIKDPWGQRFFKLGSKWYNLNEVEHQILRKMGDARIHFAIVCASVSCPTLENKAFTATDLDKQLTVAAKRFLLDETKNNISEDKVKLSKIFKWFAKDFKQNSSLASFLSKYSGVDISEKVKISYNTYDWNLNE